MTQLQMRESQPRALWVAVVVSLMAAGAMGQEVSLSEDFEAYQDGSDGEDTWYSDSIAWEVRGGRFVVDGPTSIAYMGQQPQFKQITMEATLVVREATGSGWKVAGICLYSDRGNFWHFALAEIPDGGDGRHFCELVEMKDGAWLSQSNLNQTASDNTEIDWQYNTAYRLRLAMSPEGIEGRLLDMGGAELARVGYAFSAEAVTAGRPALRSGSFRAAFDDVSVTASAPEPAEARERKAYPAYDTDASDLFRSDATGFFRTERRGDRWWVIDPTGRAFYAVGTDHCRYSGHWCQKLGYAPYGKKNDARWESVGDWAQRATGRLTSWGFNLLGAGNGPECRYRGLAHTEFISFGSTFSGYDDICPQVHWTGFPNVFSPRWPAYCDKRARAICQENANDPWLFGYFLDNELEWYGKSHREWGLFDEAMQKPAGHSAKGALVDLLRARHATIADLNEAWGADLESFDAIMELEALTGTNGEAVRDGKVAFVRLVAEKYFEHTTAAIRKHDPNHMVIGSRFAGGAPAGIWDICGKYCDIVTFNYYGRVDLERGEAPGLAEHFTQYYEQAQKPLMITEWSFPALDSGLPCKHGAGMRVDTQQQRAECFRIFQKMVFRLPFMVGSDFFMWVDEPALGISDTFPEDTNYGLVDEDDGPYPELTAMATRVNATAYKIHSGDYPDIGVREGYVVFNRGQAPAEFTLRVRLDGVRREQQMALEPGEERAVGLDWQPSPGGHVVAMEADPERVTADGDRANNLLVESTWTEGIQLPPEVGGAAAVALVISNRSGRRIEDAVAMVGRGELPPELRAERLAVMDLAGRPVECQVDSEGLAVRVGDLEAWGCRTLLLAETRQGDEPPAEAAAGRGDAEGKLVVDNGVLALVANRGAAASGNVFDDIIMDGVRLGSYNPLVWQEVDGQDQWVAASTGTAPGLPAATSGGAVREVMIGGGRGGQGGAITAVDGEGMQERRRGDPVAFEVLHRVVVYPQKNWFLTRLDSIRNISQRPLKVKGYFFYVRGAIGGDAEGDRPAGPDVPNYYARIGGAWQDDEVGYVLGALALDDELLAHFWLDEAGGQHPDARRQLSPPAVLAPGEVYQDEDEPWLLVYAGKAADEPWKRIRDVARELRAVAVSVHGLRGQPEP